MSMIYGHRGASAYAPENTLEAFEMAAKMGADGVELDVHLSRDGELVVTHDETIERVSDGEGWVKDYTLAELKRFRFNRTHPEFGDARIPTLREVYELLKPTGLKINVELKTGFLDYPGIEEKCLELAAKMGMSGRTLYSSFNHHSLRRIREMDPAMPCGMLYMNVMLEPWEYAAKHHMNALHPHFAELRIPDLVRNAHACQIEVNPWTVNSEEELIGCLRLGADRIITNFPDRGVRMREMLEKGKRDEAE